MEIIKQISLKKRNKRIEITLIKKDEQYLFIVCTKRLVDFKTRDILFSQCNYSVESFLAIAEVMNVEFLKDSVIMNKIIHKEVSKLDKFDIKGYKNKKYY